MGRLIDTVEAIPKTVIKKFLEEGTKDVSNNILEIVREEYIHKSEYENRLKADMVAMLMDLCMDFEDCQTVEECYALLNRRIADLKS